LITTLRQGVPRRLIDMSDANLTATAMRNYAAQVSQATRLRDDIARLAIETWAFALGLKTAGAVARKRND